MTAGKIQKAISEANRFIRLAKAVMEDRNEGWTITGNKASGALRRASMDLTRALAEMRKPG